MSPPAVVEPAASDAADAKSAASAPGVSGDAAAAKVVGLDADLFEPELFARQPGDGAEAQPPGSPPAEAGPDDRAPDRAPLAEPHTAAVPASPPPATETPAKAPRPQPVVHAEAVGRLSREDALIHRVFAPIATHPGAFGLTDDAAAVPPPPGCELVVTIDTLVAGVHFFADDPPGAIARKALRVNLSDLAAKAADPLGFVLSTALPEGTKPEWLDAFGRGLAADAKSYGIPAVRRRHRAHARVR